MKMKAAQITAPVSWDVSSFFFSFFFFLFNIVFDSEQNMGLKYQIGERLWPSQLRLWNMETSLENPFLYHFQTGFHSVCWKVYTTNLKYAHFYTSALELQKFRWIPVLVFSQTLYLCWMHKGLNYNLEVPLCSCNYLHFFYTVFYFYWV